MPPSDVVSRHRARWVVPVCAPPIEGGEISLRGGAVVSVGRFAGGAAEDHGEAILLPALVNAHTHLDWSHRRGIARPTEGDFTDWVYDLISSPLPQAGHIEEAAAASARTLAAAGVGLVGDFCAEAEVAAGRLRTSSLGGVLFVELLGLGESRTQQTIRQVETLDSFGSAERFAGNGAPSSRPLAAAPAPHGPHTVSRTLLELLAHRPAGRGRLAIHCAESQAEREFLETGQGPFRRIHERRGNWDGTWTPPGLSAVAYLDAIGLLTSGTLAVHCVDVDTSDIERLALRNVFVAICPRSNAWTHAGQAPLPALLRAGVRCCLGTDSLASNADLDMAAEMAFTRRAWPEIPPGRVVHMATLAGAEALGMAGATGFGRLESGARDAIAVCPIPPGTPDSADPHAILCGDHGPVAFHALN